MIVGREMDYAKKAVLQEQLYCQENAMLKWLQHGCLEFLDQVDILDPVSKYF